MNDRTGRSQPERGDVWFRDELAARIGALEREVERLATEQSRQRAALSNQSFRSLLWTAGMLIAVLLTIAGVVVALPSVIASVAERGGIDARASLFLFAGAIIVLVLTTFHATRNA